MAAQDGGKAPGAQRFKSLTGIGKSEWYPNLWLRWGDAIREAGLQPNSMARSLGHELLIKKYIELIRELGRFPIEGDLLQKRNADRSFPSREVFNALGGKSQRAARILDYCKTNEGYEDVVPFCQMVSSSTTSQRHALGPEASPVGYVYLLKHGSRREYKLGFTNDRLRREGEIRLELPEKIEPIHSIATDDPSGVEAYWKRRFADKCIRNEWFALTADDVRAFKRWKRIY